MPSSARWTHGSLRLRSSRIRFTGSAEIDKEPHRTVWRDRVRFFRLDNRRVPRPEHRFTTRRERPEPQSAVNNGDQTPDARDRAVIAAQPARRGVLVKNRCPAVREHAGGQSLLVRHQSGSNTSAVWFGISVLPTKEAKLPQTILYEDEVRAILVCPTCSPSRCAVGGSTRLSRSRVR